MAKPEYRDASNGHLARVAPPWTEEKLRILRCYVEGFARACKPHPLGWYALDLFAGGGLTVSQTTGAEVLGSPLILLTAGPPEAGRVALCEKDETARNSLLDRTGEYGSRAVVFDGDANERIGDMLGIMPVRAPAFAFLDPEGSELAWSTVEAIARARESEQRKVEQLILLPTDMGFVRLFSLRQPLKPGYAEMVTRMYGSEQWRPIWERRRAGKLNADDARTEYVQLYADGLAALGYEYVQERQITKAGAAGSPMYFLLHATDHDAGETIMAWCFDKKHFRPEEELGQLPLIELPAAKRRRRVSGGDEGG